MSWPIFLAGIATMLLLAKIGTTFFVYICKKTREEMKISTEKTIKDI